MLEIYEDVPGTQTTCNMWLGVR